MFFEINYQVPKIEVFRSLLTSFVQDKILAYLDQDKNFQFQSGKDLQNSLTPKKVIEFLDDTGNPQKINSNLWECIKKGTPSLSPSKRMFVPKKELEIFKKHKKKFDNILRSIKRNLNPLY